MGLDNALPLLGWLASDEVSAMRDAGADHVCIQVIRPDDDVPRAEWRELAPALLEH